MKWVFGPDRVGAGQNTSLAADIDGLFSFSKEPNTPSKEWEAPVEKRRVRTELVQIAALREPRRPLLKTPLFGKCTWRPATISPGMGNDQTERRGLWRGLVELRRLPDSELLCGSTGAFTWIVTWASNSAEFRNRTEMLATSLGLYVFGIEGEHPIDKDECRPVAEGIAELIERAEGNPDAILYGTFHTWRHDDA